jgi:hypothetical protein
MAVIKIPKQHREAAVIWLHEHVDNNIKHSEYDHKLSPIYISTTAQIAIWKSQNGLWEVEQRGRWYHALVTCKDERVLLEIALKFS